MSKVIKLDRTNPNLEFHARDMSLYLEVTVLINPVIYEFYISDFRRHIRQHNQHPIGL